MSHKTNCFLCIVILSMTKWTPCAPGSKRLLVEFSHRHLVHWPRNQTAIRSSILADLHKPLQPVEGFSLHRRVIKTFSIVCNHVSCQTQWFVFRHKQLITKLLNSCSISLVPGNECNPNRFIDVLSMKLLPTDNIFHYGKTAKHELKSPTLVP